MIDLELYQKRLDYAIRKTNPKAINPLFSGGYDSMIMSHILNRLNTRGIPVITWSVDTNLSADGWVEFVSTVAKKYEWEHQIYNNRFGFLKFLEFVITDGLPRTPSGHTYAYQKLKETAFNSIHALTKASLSFKDIPSGIKPWQIDKIYEHNGIISYYRNGLKKHKIFINPSMISNTTLFVTGMRRSESKRRERTPILERKGTSTAYWLALIVDWKEEDCYNYRVNYELPDNPFYDTVSGSGDCLCNWGVFVVYEILKRFSPKLANGNVALLNAISTFFHYMTWDHKSTRQNTLPTLDDYKEPAILTTPFLCEGCSRRKQKPKTELIEKTFLQRGLW